MKRFLHDIGKFIVIAALLYSCFTLLSVAFIPQDYRDNLPYKPDVGFLYTRLQEAKQTTDVDVLVLGSSHAFKDYDVRIFEQYGYSAFILGSSAQTPVQTKFLLEKYIDRLNPKLVIFDVYADVFARDGVESSMDLVINDNIDYKLLQMVLTYNNMKLYNVTLYSFLATRLCLKKDIILKKQKGPQRYIKAGFAPTTSQYTKKHIRKEPLLRLEPRQMKAFAEIIRILADRRLHYILVQTPVTARRYRLHKEDINVDSFFAAHGPYYNYNTVSPFLQEEHFSDDSHLNERGAAEFTKRLLPTVKARLINDTLTSNN